MGFYYQTVWDGGNVKVLIIGMGSIIFVAILFILYVLGLALFQKHTDLSTEILNQFATGEDVGNMNGYEEDANYYFDPQDDLVLFKLDKRKTINYLTTNIESSSENVIIARGIALGDTIEQVKEVYGENYSEVKFVELYGTRIQYKDKENRILIIFYYNAPDDREKVRGIEILSTK